MKTTKDIDVRVSEVVVYVEVVEVKADDLAGSTCTVWRREHPRRHREGAEKEGT